MNSTQYNYDETPAPATSKKIDNFLLIGGTVVAMIFGVALIPSVQHKINPNSLYFEDITTLQQANNCINVVNQYESNTMKGISDENINEQSQGCIRRELEFEETKLIVDPLHDSKIDKKQTLNNIAKLKARYVFIPDTLGQRILKANGF